MKMKIWIFCCLIILSVSHAFSQEIFPAVMRGDLGRVKILLEEHPEWANATSWGGWTPLHRAAQFGHGDIVDLLISNGLEVDVTWTEAKNMCDTINTPARESTSIVSPDGEYLFFMSRRNGTGEFFWVDTKIIKDLESKESK